MKHKGYKPRKEFTLKQKILGSVGFLLLYRLLSFVPLPFVDGTYIKTLIGANGSLGLLNMMTGGSLGNMSFTALGIGPYITASIVLQLLGIAWPKIADLNKDESGKKTYKLITLGLSAVLALLEAFGLVNGFGKAGYLGTYAWYTVLIPTLLMALGSGMLSLMGWYMDERLFGNGTSLILTTGILSSYVGDGATLGLVLGYGKALSIQIVLCLTAALVLFIIFLYTVFVSSCEKRIPVVYAKGAAKTNIKNTSTIPIKLITGGVVPVIFASTIITFPSLIGMILGSDAEWLELFNTSCWLRAGHTWQNLGLVLYVALIIGFGYFCQLLYVNPLELADNLKKSGGTIPGVRPGKPTADYITSQAKWLTALGGIFLTIIAVIPMAVSGVLGVGNLSFLGTSVLIVVSTIDETWNTWKTSRMAGSYKKNGPILKGFL